MPQRHEVEVRGFSLVEMIVALGLLAGALVSVAGMFVLGQRQVSSGRNSSEALAVARTILEELHGWGFRQTYELFEEASCNPAGDAACTVDTKTNRAAANWQRLLDAALEGGRAEIAVESLGGAPLGAASAIRIVVDVRWVEGERKRSVALATVRL